MIIKEIGRGMHGKVKLAQDLDTGELVAIKIVDKQSRRRQLGYSVLRAKSTGESPFSESEQKIRREIAILKKCAHPHVVRLREVIDDPASRKIYLALEYMEGGEIIWRQDDESNIPVLSMSEARDIFRDVVSGLDYLHYQGIIHRDIKPANLLLTRDRIVKISDFGVSYFNQHLAGHVEQYDDEIDRELAETAGTPAFFAPELCSSVENNHDEKHITKAIDVWALGVTLYCLIYGQCPFTASTEFELFDIIPTLPLSFPTVEQIGFETPHELMDLLSKLLTKDPDERITLDGVKHHVWVIQDLEDPSIWWKESDPTSYKTVHVTDEEVSSAVTILGKLRKSIHRISSSISNTFTRRGSKSSSLSDIHPSPTNSIISPISSHHEPSLHEEHQDHSQNHHDGWLPTSFTNMTLSPSSSTSSSSLHKPQSPPPTKIERHDSSSSSMSGLLVTFNRTPDKH
ncbi:kinase-like domain-containing protein [Mucor mucedo]|uniref:kinase-like domain-containing protein n=1 Tax=Mucor mucedo TaxID=29922 RepID=UPI00221FD7DB|nr:kinase-like domain-containing protein [Mucor mucedo]KAI7893391.1 kinase-like domain-containing protein [Mucor mucedo]